MTIPRGSRIRARSHLLALAMAGLLCAASAGAQQAAEPMPPDLIDDDGIVAHMEKAGTAMIKAGSTIKTKALRGALAKATTCALELPPVEEKTLAPEEIFARRAEGVVVVGVLSKVKKKLKYEMAGCSGFVLAAGGVVVTNYHVIDSPEAETFVVMTRDGKVVPVTEVLAANKLSDVAIVRAPGVEAPPLPLGTVRPLTGAPIWVISHPDHNFFSLTAGLVARHFVAVTEFGRTPQMAVTADFGAGSSGGPVLDRQGSVVGMVCSTTSVYWEDEKGKEKDLQMVFKHCVPAASIRQLVLPPAFSSDQVSH